MASPRLPATTARITTLWNSLPSTATLLIALSLALLPLGILSLLAAIDNYRFARDRHGEDARMQLITVTRELSSTIDRDVVALRAASTVLHGDEDDREQCVGQLARLIASNRSIEGLAVIANSTEVLCEAGIIEHAPTDHAQIARLSTVPAEPLIAIDTDGQGLRLYVRGEEGQTAVATIALPYLQSLTEARQLADVYDFAIHDGQQTMAIDPPSLTSGTTLNFSRPLPGTGAEMTITTRDSGIRPGEALAAMLPLLMWAAALAVAWLVVHTLVSRPLGRMRRAVALYAAGHPEIRLSAIASGGIETASLAQAFDDMAEGVERHERDMVASLERQRRLVREVHHRVKNNLQVIASLLNIHARRAPSPEAAQAYAAIQRRVDALALVHRHHYAEEEDAGIRIDALLKELLPSLKGRDDDGLSLSLSVDEGRVTQDVAVAVAFILAEILSDIVQRPDHDAPIAISFRNQDGLGELSIASDDFRGEDPYGPTAQSDVARIIQGMARKMRAPLLHDAEAGRYSLAVPLVAPGQAVL